MQLRAQLRRTRRARQRFPAPRIRESRKVRRYQSMDRRHPRSGSNHAAARGERRMRGDTPIDWRTMPLAGRVLIEASAGTGKTYTIGLIYLRMLLERGLRVEQILVATFTERAAQELRDRLRTRLIETEHAIADAAPAGDDA